ncbi:PIR Superfamily Protein [Plasmodium ovale wallikeri]|uniref:PIR Superfamily Protein n=1 Tax=Plasmodium ovale wallikeri TaxID=864142 RepID=A0A1A9AKE6_PLAOA|nr:PIR Superfamily Protein [Plasmodium ovale wallikeri]SBT56693.1 PIR Superfamily Protein [Plasmodium ovale wallikeri]
MTLYATLEDLPSYKFYKKFDESDGNTYYSTCKAQERINSDEQLVQLCSRILKNLKLLAETHNGDTFRDKRCNDLNYWISEQLYESHSVIDDPISISPTYIALYMALHNIRKTLQIYDKCSIDFNDITTKERRKRKNLYDYYENYKELEGIFTENDNKCKKEHYEYLDKCVDLYKESQQLCTQGNTAPSSKCPPLFDHSAIYCPGKILSEMPCELEVQSGASVGLVSENEMLTKENVEISPLSGLPSPDDRSDTDSSSEPSPSLSKTVISTSIPALGSCFFFFILYRWTPVGSIIRNRLLNRGGEINELHNNVGEELWEDTMEPLNINSDRNGYQLAYQSI